MKSEHTPPLKWLDTLLMWLVAPHLREEVLGDLHERYHRRAQRLGKHKAKTTYWREVLAYVRPRFIKRQPSGQRPGNYSHPFLLHPDMIRNYAKIAFRSLMKHKLYSGINIFGLALGMACALLIGLWVRDELSYDRFLPDADNVYFVRFNTTFNGQTYTNYTTPGPLQEAIAKDIPQVAAVTKLSWNRETLIKVGQVAAKQAGRYATADFFGVFDLPAIYGNPKAALAQNNQIVITRRVAETFFPAGLALGKTLQLDNDKFYVVGAVIENVPVNATVQFDWLVNFSVQEQDWMKTWGNNTFLTYARLKPNRTGGPTSAARAQAAMSNLYARYTDWKEAKSTLPILHPITDVHLYSEYKNGKVVGGRIEYVRIFSIVALFILLIACINFMNLATARSALRAKEVGIRKVVGAGRSSLIGQFLSEAMLTSLLAIILALVFVLLILPTFNTLFEKQLTLNLGEPALWGIVGGLMGITGLLAGSYPALFLSSLQPIKILKGRLQFGAGPTFFRRSLVVFQFSLSVFLIVGMLAVGRQMDYLRTKNLGLDRENVVYLRLEGEIAQPKKVELFRQAVMRNPSIVAATIASDLPMDVTSTSGDLKWAGKGPNQGVDVSALSVGGDFIKTMNIKLLDGRDFRVNSPADSLNYIINETAAKLMGMSSPVGNEITFWNGKGRIVGLMKDFHLNSLHQAIRPLILVYNPFNTNVLLVKIRADQTQRAVADLERLTKQANPNYPFDYHFVEEDYEKLYQSEQQVNTLVNYFGVLAILISCLGLFGLAAFTAEQRTKEIGVRKVLGASVASIVGLLSSDFLRLVIVALVLATPVAWWATSKWLGTFEYKADLAWWIFGVAGLLAVMIALLTVSFQSVKAALMNPVTSLRSE